MKPEFSAYALEIIHSMPDVKVILGDRAIIDDELRASAPRQRYVAGNRTVKTEKGETIDADLIFFTTGGKADSKFLAKTFPDKVNERGEVKVNRFLQVEGFENIFAAGDCTDIPESKQAGPLRAQASTVTANVKNIIAKRPLKENAAGMVGMVVPIGS